MRGREYRGDDSGRRFDPLWLAQEIDSIASTLREGIQKKERRDYPQGTVLLVYQNISGHGICQAETEDTIVRLWPMRQSSLRSMSSGRENYSVAATP
jgi:hypothetical protein